MNIRELLNKRRIYFDGGMGTLLQKKGLKPGEKPELWNITHAEDITDIHLAYLNAGSNVITTNTFGASCLKFGNLEEIISSAINNARKAIELFEGDKSDRFVAFDMGPTGKMLEPIGDMPFEKAVEVFAENVRLAAKYGADLIIIETMNDSYETKAAVLAAKENSDLPVFVTNVFDEKGKLMTGADAKAMIAMLEGLGADAIGMNCSLGPKQMLPRVAEYVKYASVKLFFPQRPMIYFFHLQSTESKIVKNNLNFNNENCKIQYENRVYCLYPTLRTTDKGAGCNLLLLAYQSFF